MTNTFNLPDGAGKWRTAKDAVRSYIGDTDPLYWQLADEQIEAILVVESNPRLAAAIAAEQLYAKYATRVDFTTPDFAERNDQRLQHFKQLAEMLRTQAAGEGCVALLASDSHDAKRVRRQNLDLPQPFFRRDMETHPGTMGGGVESGVDVDSDATMTQGG